MKRGRGGNVKAATPLADVDGVYVHVGACLSHYSLLISGVFPDFIQRKKLKAAGSSTSQTFARTCLRRYFSKIKHINTMLLISWWGYDRRAVFGHNYNCIYSKPLVKANANTKPEYQIFDVVLKHFKTLTPHHCHQNKD